MRQNFYHLNDKKVGLNYRNSALESIYASLTCSITKMGGTKSLEKLQDLSDIVFKLPQCRLASFFLVEATNI